VRPRKTAYESQKENLDRGDASGNRAANRGGSRPEKIILFGSAAREEMGPDSDLDLLVIKTCRNRRATARRIRRKLIGVGVPKDIIVATPEDIERY
jgi:predicted nucleotidyltransferase